MNPNKLVNSGKLIKTRVGCGLADCNILKRICKKVGGSRPAAPHSVSRRPGLKHPSRRLNVYAFMLLPDQYMSGGGPACPPGAGFGSGFSVTAHSVVRSSPAIEELFSMAIRTTLVGSITPAFTMSSILPSAAL